VLRERLQAALKEAGEKGDGRAAATLRLVLAALDERDRSAREEGGREAVDDEAIVAMLREMIEQRRAEIARCEACARLEEAEREAEEIAVLERFLPPQMSEEEIARAVEATIDELDAHSLKDTGKVIAALKSRFDGHMDLGRAKRMVCERLDCGCRQASAERS